MAMPPGPRRTASMVQAMTCAPAVANTSQSRIATWAWKSLAGTKLNAIDPSRIQAWIIQAMLSGASSSAPRWSVVGLIGYGDAWSREMSSRPPPEAIAEAMLRTRMPAIAEGIRARTWARALLGPWSTNDGTTATATVMPRNTSDSTRVKWRRRTACLRNCSRILTSATARRAAARCPGRRYVLPVSVEESAVGTCPLLAGHLLGVHRRDPRAASEHERGATGLDREVAQVRREQDRGPAGAGVRDHLERRLN